MAAKRKRSRAGAAQQLIRGTTESITILMKKRGVTRSELARRMKRTNAYVTQMLSGDRNLTLRTIADVAKALDATPRVVLKG